MRRPRLAAIVLAFLTLAAPATAGPIVIDFEGVLTSVTGSFVKGFSVGDAFTGIATYTPFSEDDPLTRYQGAVTISVDGYLVESTALFAQPGAPWLFQWAGTTYPGVGGPADNFTLSFPTAAAPGAFSLQYRDSFIRGAVTGSPEPASILLLLVGSCVLWRLRRQSMAVPKKLQFEGPLNLPGQ